MHKKLFTQINVKYNLSIHVSKHFDLHCTTNIILFMESPQRVVSSHVLIGIDKI